jgi:flagellar hook assembly protein FlgD
MQIPTTVPKTPPIARNVLFQNYPNPFNPTTLVRYGVASAGDVVITIYNVRGQTVKTLVDETKLPGIYQTTWDGTNERGQTVASGVYFYHLRARDFRATKKMVLLK